MIRIRFNGWQARVYPEGGIGFDQHIEDVGWIVQEKFVDPVIEELAIAARAIAFPFLAPIPRVKDGEKC